MATAQNSVLLGGLSGKAGSVVFAQTRSGVVIRPYVTPRNPRTPAQIETRTRMKAAQAAYALLTPAQILAWHVYAETLPPFDARTGRPKRRSAYTAFLGLACKFQQANPGVPLPAEPPSLPFLGDGIVVTATGGPGGVTFAASGPNSESVLTELLLQPLPSAVRAPQAGRWRSQVFASFTEGALSAMVAALPGWVAPAVRFVAARTGQETAPVPLPTVRVG